MKKNRNIFIFGIALSYISLIIVSSSWAILVSFGLFFIFSYQYLDCYKKAIFISAVFSIPYTLGKALLVADNRINILILTPFAGFTLLLSLLTIRNKLNARLHYQDLFLYLFLLWGFLSYGINSASPEVMNGLFKLCIGVLFYCLVRIYSKDIQIRKTVILILLSFIVFEAILTIAQLLIGHPLGLFIEKSIKLYPYGRIVFEQESLFRPSGTMVEPTYLARFINMLLPFVFLEMQSIIILTPMIRLIFIFLALLTIFATLTRVSMAIAITIIIFIFIWKRPKVNFTKLKKPIYLFLSIFLIIFIFGQFPQFEHRIKTSGRSFEPGGSFDYRIKLIQEAFNLINLYPIFGVGLNRFKQFALEYNITGYFQTYQTPVHNVFLLIASEMGFPALIFFIGFIMFSFSGSLISKKQKKTTFERNLIDAATLGGFIYLLESMVGTIFLSPHFFLFLLYMGIITI